MNPPPAPPEEGSQCRARLPSSPPGRGQGWVGSWRASTTFLSRIGTMNRCASQRRGPDRGSATRSLLGSWKGGKHAQFPEFSRPLVLELLHGDSRRLLQGTS